jgi:hypothetical protein
MSPPFASPLVAQFQGQRTVLFAHLRPSGVTLQAPVRISRTQVGYSVLPMPSEPPGCGSGRPCRSKTPKGHVTRRHDRRRRALSRGSDSATAQDSLPAGGLDPREIGLRQAEALSVGRSSRTPDLGHAGAARVEATGQVADMGGERRIADGFRGRSPYRGHLASGRDRDVPGRRRPPEDQALSPARPRSLRRRARPSRPRR